MGGDHHNHCGISGDRDLLRGYLVRTNSHGACVNCDGRLCMECVVRGVHDECVRDCPECCGTPLPGMEVIGDVNYSEAYGWEGEALPITERF